MTAGVVLAVFLASVFLYRSTEWDGYLFGLSFYVLTFLAGLLTATAFAALSKDRRCIYGIAVLWLNFIGNHFAGDDPDLVISGMLNVATAAYFILYGITRWEWVIGGLYLASVLLAFLSFVGVIPGAEERVAVGFIAFSLPDLVTIISEIALAVLGLGAGDSGRRVRVRLRVPVPWAAGTARARP